MAKYSDWGMSEFAVQAYISGLVPASKVKGVPAALIQKFCAQKETHVTSGFFNKTSFYDPYEVRAAFGLGPKAEKNPLYDGEAARALQLWKASKKTKIYQVFENCTAEWTEYLGKKHYPQAITKRVRGVKVEIDGSMATITLASGERIKKRTSGKGFRFWKNEPQTSEPKQLAFKLEEND
jgi:hypothetical protein